MTATNDAVIACLELIWVRPGGAEVPIRAAVGRPYQIGAAEWACPATQEGGHRSLPDARGGDSMQQALCLALFLRRAQLEDRLARGGREALSLADLAAAFGQVGGRDAGSDSG